MGVLDWLYSFWWSAPPTSEVMDIEAQRRQTQQNKANTVSQPETDDDDEIQALSLNANVNSSLPKIKKQILFYKNQHSQLFQLLCALKARSISMSDVCGDLTPDLQQDLAVNIPQTLFALEQQIQILEKRMKEIKKKQRKMLPENDNEVELVHKRLNKLVAGPEKSGRKSQPQQNQQQTPTTTTNTTTTNTTNTTTTNTNLESSDSSGDDSSYTTETTDDSGSDSGSDSGTHSGNDSGKQNVDDVGEDDGKGNVERSDFDDLQPKSNSIPLENVRSMEEGSGVCVEQQANSSQNEMRRKIKGKQQKNLHGVDVKQYWL